MKPLSVRVSRDNHTAFRQQALRHGLSVNQYLKFLVLRELGQQPPEKMSQEAFIRWLRGK